MPLIQEQFFDIGANLTHKSFNDDLELVLSEADELGVKRLSITGSCLEDSRKAYEITKKFPKSCVSTAGIHPHNAKEYSIEVFSEVKELLGEDSVKCIGETGLDFNRNFSKRADGNPNTHAFVTSPEMVAAIAISGRLDFNPISDTLVNQEGDEVKLDPPTGIELPPRAVSYTHLTLPTKA